MAYNIHTFTICGLIASNDLIGIELIHFLEFLRLFMNFMPYSWLRGKIKKNMVVYVPAGERAWVCRWQVIFDLVLFLLFKMTHSNQMQFLIR